ncbi:MAG: hypothetical protein M3R27_08750 [Bacteroidota bacterium]|nr:hypothetical protein [Bacteroidota bacterium]
MNMTDVFNGIGSFFQWTFGMMKALGNGPNIFFWILIAVLICVWLRMQGRYNKEAKERGNLK